MIIVGRLIKCIDNDGVVSLTVFAKAEKAMEMLTAAQAMVKSGTLDMCEDLGQVAGTVEPVISFETWN